jgi:hypothetical protein
MKRDMDLVREVLLRIEELPFDGRFHDIAVDVQTEEEVNYHVMLLHEAGFIEAMDLSSLSGICWKPTRLTYSGHEFLDAARSDTIWQEAKAWTLKSTGTLTLEGLKLALPHVVKALIESGG